MKKALTILLSFVMIVCLFGCSSAERPVSRGSIDGDVYTSEFTGITFTKSSGWEYLSDEEIAKQLNTSAEVIAEGKFAESLAEMESLFDMVAMHSSGSSVNVTYENLTLTQGVTITEEKYLNAALEQINSETSLSTELADTADVTLSGATYLRATLRSTFSGIEITQYIYIRKISNFMVNITVSLAGDVNIDDIEAMFS